MKAIIKHTLTAATLCYLVACGGGGGDTVSSVGTAGSGTTGGGTTGGGTTGGGTTGGGSSIPTQTNTQAVLNYINTRHASVQPTFLSTAEPTAKKHSALGSLSGGNHLAESINNYISAVQSFLNDSVTNARSLNALLPVDSASVANLLRTYKTQDANYVATYYGAWPYVSVSIGVINDAKERVNNAYESAIANLP